MRYKLSPEDQKELEEFRKRYFKEMEEMTGLKPRKVSMADRWRADWKISKEIAEKEKNKKQ